MFFFNETNFDFDLLGNEVGKFLALDLGGTNFRYYRQFQFFFIVAITSFKLHFFFQLT